jgi:hypothetical protein
MVTINSGLLANNKPLTQFDASQVFPWVIRKDNVIKSAPIEENMLYLNKYLTCQ